VDSSGHWHAEIEEELNDICDCERLPKLLTPRKNINSRGQIEIWAMKLIHKLQLLGPE